MRSIIPEQDGAARVSQVKPGKWTWHSECCGDFTWRKEGNGMPTYAMLTRLTPEAVKAPGELKRLERIVLDILDAPDEIVAAKVVMTLVCPEPE